MHIWQAIALAAIFVWFARHCGLGPTEASGAYGFWRSWFFGVALDAAVVATAFAVAYVCLPG